MTRQEIIQKAVFAALGCTKIDYRKGRKMDEAASQIARFVEAALSEGEEPIKCNLPFERLPQCGCDPGHGDPPTRQQMLECKLRGGPCAGGHDVDSASTVNPSAGE